MTVTVADLQRALERAYPPALAQEWDTGIGLTCGDPQAPVRRVLLAVDVDLVTVAEAVETDVQLLVTHHPLLFRRVQSVAAYTAKGALLHRLIRAGIAHLACHTNADDAVGGVNDALAARLGLADVRPLEPAAEPALDKIVVFVPVAATEAVLAAMGAAGAGRLGDYTDAAFVSAGTGRFRPGPAATPAVGVAGRLELVEEQRVEVIAARTDRAAVVAALRAAHPYQEPAFDVLELADRPGRAGSGRIGRLPEPLSLNDFTELVARTLPPVAAGVRAAGDPTRRVRDVALCGGAGGSLLDAATRSGADVFLTSDLSHHVVAEHVADPRRPAVVEVAHWAGEWPWLAAAAGVVEAATAGTVTSTVSTFRTDPWTVHHPSR